MFKKYSNKNLNENVNYDNLRNILGNKNIDVKNIQRNLLFDENLAQKRLNTFLELNEELNYYFNLKSIKIEIIKEDLDNNIYIIDIIKNSTVDKLYNCINLSNFLKYKYMDINGNESINLVNINYIDFKTEINFENFDINIKYDGLIPKIINNEIRIINYNNNNYINDSIYYCNQIYLEKCNIKNLNNIENIFNINNIDNIKYLTSELKSKYKYKISKNKLENTKQTQNEIFIINNKEKIIIPTLSTHIDKITFAFSDNMKFDNIIIIKNNNIKSICIYNLDEYIKDSDDIVNEKIEKILKNINNELKYIFLYYINISSLNFGGKYNEIILNDINSLVSLDGLYKNCKNVYINIKHDMPIFLKNKKYFEMFYNSIINISNQTRNILEILFSLDENNKNKNIIKRRIDYLIKLLKNQGIYGEKIRIIKFF